MKTVYEFVGGEYHNMRMPLKAVQALSNGRYSEDWSSERVLGAIVPREELDNQPLVDGYFAPIWDGTRMDPVTQEYYAVLRYETAEVYEMLIR